MVGDRATHPHWLSRCGSMACKISMGSGERGKRVITLLHKPLLVKMDPAEETILFWGLSKEDGRSEVMCFEEELP